MHAPHVLACNVPSLSCVHAGQFMFAVWVSSMLKKNTTFKRLKATSGKSGFVLVLGLRLSPMPSYMCSYGASVRSLLVFVGGSM